MSSCNLLFLLTIIFFHATTGSSAIPPHNCTGPDGNSTVAPSSTYHLNIQTLLSWLSSNATASTQLHFYVATVGKNTSDTVYGLFMCGPDPNVTCQECIKRSAKWITKLCPMAKEAIVWVPECFVRYSNRHFFSTMEEKPKLSINNEQDYEGQISHFNNVLWDTMYHMRTSAAKCPTKSSYKSVKITHNQMLYVSAWCIPHLSTENCSWCLMDATAAIRTSRFKGKSGGRVLYPSCGVRFELYPFYQLLALAPTGNRKLIKTIISVVVPSIVLMVMLCMSCGCFLHRRHRNTQKAILKENFGHEATTLESLRFDLGEVESATNRFAKENRIGRGGFGEVYKGILSNGQEIAVKRLSKSSRQGAKEFKNEVLVMAQLQHRNLVRLQGFCVDRKENILLYEYVTNKSLDYFLLDLQKRRQLTWSKRFEIIRGIARGVLYLHEDSRLKIIHRDLKPSNILLDNNIYPKISDFGMARNVIADQGEANTCRIVGTYGYMSPEYAMYGQFSVKSDVFSFGVIVLEIISGKRKCSSDESDYIDDIRQYAWRKWRQQTPVELLDSCLEGSYSENEVIRCIQIGLLCVQEDPKDRPTMAKIVSYLNNPSVYLPLPNEPALFMHRKKDDIMPRRKLDSINEMTISEFHPR